MTERKPLGMTFESWIDRQIRVAQERGDFNDLEGTGEPLPGAGQPHDEMWWVKGYVEREGLSREALLPTPLQLRKEIERLPETVRELPTEQAVRDVAGELNRRVVAWLRTPSGPQVPIATVRIDALVERWRDDRTTGTPPPAAPTENPRAEHDGRWRRFTRYLRGTARYPARDRRR